MERLIFHVDVNSAYLSWESARRVKEGQADLRLIPSCIGGNPRKRTGVVLAKSIPAKQFGCVPESLWEWLCANVRSWSLPHRISDCMKPAPKHF